MRLRAFGMVLVLGLFVAVPATADAQASAYVIHGISGGSLGLASFGLPVDVAVDGACAITDFTFTDIVGPIELAKGDHNIQIFLATSGTKTCTGTPVIDADVTLKNKRNYSIVAHADANGAPTASVFRNEALEGARVAGEATVAVRHTAAAPDVDVLVSKGNSVTALGPFGNGEQLGEIPLGKGTYDLGLALPGTTDPVFGYFAQKFAKNETYYVYAFGAVGNGTLALVVHNIR